MHLKFNDPKTPVTFSLFFLFFHWSIDSPEHSVTNGEKTTAHTKTYPKKWTKKIAYTNAKTHVDFILSPIPFTDPEQIHMLEMLLHHE